jgi:hypothetical protein
VLYAPLEMRRTQYVPSGSEAGRIPRSVGTTAEGAVGAEPGSARTASKTSRADTTKSVGMQRNDMTL